MSPALYSVECVDKVRVGTSVLTLLVGDGKTEIYVLGRYLKGSLGERSALVAKHGPSASSSRIIVDAVSIGAFYVDLAVLVPKLVYLGTLGCVEIAVEKRLSYCLVIKLFRVYGCPRPAGITATRFNRTEVVVVVSADAVYSLSSAEHIVVNSGVVIVKASTDTRAVEYLKGVHSVEIHVIGVVLERPRGVIVGYEKSCVAAHLHVLAAALSGMLTPIVRLALVKLHEMSVVGRVSEKIRFSVPTGLYLGLGVKSYTAEMTGFENIEIIGSLVAWLIGLYLEAVEGEKLVVAKLGMANENVVVGVGNYRISLIEIYLLYLFGSAFSVGQISVAVKICLVKIFVLRKKNLFHTELLYRIKYFRAYYITAKKGCQDIIE